MSGRIPNPQTGSIRASESVLKIPAFRRLWNAMSFSSFGDWRTPNRSKFQNEFTRKRATNGKLAVVLLTFIDNFGNKRIANRYLEAIRDFNKIQNP